jgi:hypothetical protein
MHDEMRNYGPALRLIRNALLYVPAKVFARIVVEKIGVILTPPMPVFALALNTVAGVP